jgi:mannose-1-phosphate guanylyltransferase
MREADYMLSVIMAGGSGTRFWPMSRKRMPKQFLRIYGSEPIIVETCRRIRPLSKEDEIIIITNKEHMSYAKELFHGTRIRIIAEPVGRNTAPCIGLGAVLANHMNIHDPISFLPADHYIGRPEVLISALREASRAVSSGGIATIGIMPDRAETGYGYIRRGDPVEGLNQKKAHGDMASFYVDAFVEKPDLETATRYIESGMYYWNAGIFIATPGAILNQIERHLPNLFKALMRLQDALRKGTFEKELEEVYSLIEDVSFDYGIMEKADCPVYVIPCDCGWADVGSWQALYQLKAKEHDKDGNLTIGNSLLIDCKSTFINSSNGPFIACVGIKDCLIVHTEDAILIADINRSQDIKQVVEVLKKSGREELL